MFDIGFYTEFGSAYTWLRGPTIARCVNAFSFNIGVAGFVLCMCCGVCE